jgi:hypothetical protein
LQRKEAFLPSLSVSSLEERRGSSDHNRSCIRSIDVGCESIDGSIGDSVISSLPPWVISNEVFNESETLLNVQKSVFSIIDFDVNSHFIGIHTEAELTSEIKKVFDEYPFFVQT